MKAEVRQIKELSLIGKADSNHWVPMDSIKALKGAEAGTRPLELVLIALGGCAGMDVISLLGKRRAPLQNLELTLEAEQTKEYPRVFTDIHIKYIFRGKGLKDEDVRWAIEASQNKYCPVGAMLGETAEISYSWEIVEA